MADRRVDHHPGGRRRPGRPRPLRRTASHRDRRDQLSPGAQVLDRRGGPRLRPPGVGRGRPGQGHPRAVLRPAGRRTLSPGETGVCRCRRVDRHRGRRTVPERHTLCRRVPHGVVGDQGARRGSTGHLAGGEEDGGTRPHHPDQGVPLRIAEEPRAPHRQAAGRPRSGRPGQQDPLPGLLAQGAISESPGMHVGEFRDPWWTDAHGEGRVRSARA